LRRAPALCLALTLVGSIACKSEPKPAERRPGHLDCDGKSDNGAETNIQNDAKHCGRCNNACAAKNGTATCTNGECKATCNAGFAACGKPSDGCMAKLSSSAEHCGKCGNHCFTGYCQDSKCVESEILASDVYSYGVVTHDDDFVYMNRAGGEKHFWRFPVAGGKLEKVGEEGAFVPYLFDGKSYYGCRETPEKPPPANVRWGTCLLVRGPFDGAAKLVQKLERFALGTITLANDTLYYGTMVADVDSDQGAIHSVPLAGGEPKLVVETPEPLSVAVDGNDVFYSSGGTRKAENKDAGLFVLRDGAPKLLYRGRARSLVLDGSHLYFNGADVVMRIPKTGGDPQLVAAPPPRWRGGIYGLAITKTHVYYAIRGKDVNFRTLARIAKPRG
jgi:hypothetical protein